MPGVRSTPAVLATTLLLALLGGTAAAEAAPLYVALGDSYTAGPLVPMQHGTPIDCARSDHNYPSLVASALGLTLRDASCSSATTDHMTGPQGPLPLGGTNPPQFDAVTPDAALVTVGIGGNDAGLVGVAETCAQVGFAQPTGHACRDHFTAGGTDRVAARIAAAAPKVAAVLQGIHTRAPDARVALVGYPAAAPVDGTGCWPLVPMSPDDLAYVNELLVRIDRMLAEQAAANDAEFIDTYTDSIGHDVCRLPPTRWYEGIVPTEPAFPMHPNARGLASAAASALKVLGHPAPPRRPTLSALAFARAPRTAGPPAVVSFRVDRGARVRFVVRRPDRRVRVFTRTALPGTNRVRLARRLLGRHPGVLRMTATPYNGDVAGTTVTVRRRLA